jgi:hypothetical protein
MLPGLLTRRERVGRVLSGGVRTDRRECARGDDADVGFEHRAVWYGANDAIAR